ncbi:hypothetical protein T459_27946 [Capsicum annuum]|uniref:Uncharacterized protein n=1 Tax=Capsicum annuum TaxID=4072 RepID=A0A2G2YFH2_CAPAN|nr:hypothetical protein T459_27946 [Capsicum annuum]
MSDSTTPNPIGTGNVTVISEPPETSKVRAVIQHDKHVARLNQEVEDQWGELNRVKDLTNLSITLHIPPYKHRNTTPNPPHFPSLDSPIPEHFSPHHPPPTNSNLPPTTLTNPLNQPPIYTPPQSHPPSTLHLLLLLIHYLLSH